MQVSFLEIMKRLKQQNQKQIQQYLVDYCCWQKKTKEKNEVCFVNANDESEVSKKMAEKEKKTNYYCYCCCYCFLPSD